VRSRGYDLVHLHEPMLPAVCLTAIESARVPLVGTFHMARQALLWYRVFGPVVRRAATRLTARIAVSPASRDYAARALPGVYEVIPNGIDYEALAAVDSSGRRGTNVIFVGRPEPRKGLPVLLEAFRRLPGDAELVLVGPTGDFGPRIRALGHVDRKRLREELGRADVLCAPSLRGESFGVVLAEGMAAGLPVVASRISGYAPVLPESSGLLVDPGDAEALAGALACLLEDDELRLRLGQAGRREAARYAWPRVAQRVLETYSRVLSG
jgi:phosphatidylinositol alpha-mannosyltransferase